MTRIRYTKDSNGCWVSVGVFTLKTGEDVCLYIMPDGCTGAVVNKATGGIINQYKATSLHKIKIALKNYLEKNDVEFKTETRSR